MANQEKTGVTENPNLGIIYQIANDTVSDLSSGVKLRYISPVKIDYEQIDRSFTQDGYIHIKSSDQMQVYNPRSLIRGILNADFADKPIQNNATSEPVYIPYPVVDELNVIKGKKLLETSFEAAVYLLRRSFDALSLSHNLICSLIRRYQNGIKQNTYQQKAGNRQFSINDALEIRFSEARR